MDIEISSFGVKHMAFHLQQGNTAHPVLYGAAHLISALDLPNPHSVYRLKNLDGRHEDVIRMLRYAPEKYPILSQAMDAIKHLKVKHVAFFCYGGRHRSVFMAEELVRALEQSPLKGNATITHWDVDR